MDNLDIMLAIVNINDAGLNALLRLKKSNPCKEVDDAIFERLNDLYNPATGPDSDVDTIVQALDL